MEAKLVVLSGVQKNRIIPLPGTMFLIGRDKKCHLRPKSALVSRCHCAIACWAGKVAVRDLKSANGTFINDQPVHGEVRVFDGDRLRVGNLVLGFNIKLTAAEELQEPLSCLDWLLDTPPASNGQDPEGSTVIKRIELETDGNPDEERTIAPSESGTMSAGQLLREYVKSKKKRRRPTPPPPVEE